MQPTPKIDGYPRGIGMYVRRYSRRTHGTPEQLAAKAADHGLTWVAILACWQDRHQNHNRSIAHNAAVLPDLCQALADRGVVPWVWTFPRGGWEDTHQTTLRNVFDQAGDVLGGVLLDPEIYYKFKRRGNPPDYAGMRATPEAVDDPDAAESSEDWTRMHARRLIRTTLDVLDERHAIGVTSYGIPSWHSLAWEDLVAGFGSGQYYRVNERLCMKGLAEWRRLFGGEAAHLLPSVGVFGEHNLAERLGWFAGQPNVHGAIAWSWRQCDRREWRILESFADKF